MEEAQFVRNLVGLCNPSRFTPQSQKEYYANLFVIRVWFAMINRSLDFKDFVKQAPIFSIISYIGHISQFGVLTLNDAQVYYLR